jgi:hypothetical protein
MEMEKDLNNNNIINDDDNNNDNNIMFKYYAFTYKILYCTGIFCHLSTETLVL